MMTNALLALVLSGLLAYSPFLNGVWGDCFMMFEGG